MRTLVYDRQKNFLSSHSCDFVKKYFYANLLHACVQYVSIVLVKNG